MKKKTNTVTSIRFHLKKRANLTKVLGRGAVITEDSDDAGPEHLKGGNVGREDAESAGECGDVDLFHTGFFEKHLQRERNHSFPYSWRVQLVYVHLKTECHSISLDLTSACILSFKNGLSSTFLKIRF